MKRTLLAITAAIGLAVTGLALAGPASASSRHVGITGYEARCDNAGWRLCLYYNSGLLGSYWGTNKSVSNLAGITFNTAGNGRGQAVKNNAASMMCGLLTPNKCTVYFNSGYAGNTDWMYWGEIGNLYYTYNEDGAVKIT